MIDSVSTGDDKGLVSSILNFSALVSHSYHLVEARISSDLVSFTNHMMVSPPAVPPTNDQHEVCSMDGTLGVSQSSDGLHVLLEG